MSRMIGWLSILMALGLLWPTPVTAQDDAATLLPAPAVIGDDWIVVPAGGAGAPLVPDRFADTVVDAAVEGYAGPAGARATVFVFIPAESASGIRDSWELGTLYFDLYRDALQTDDDRVAELTAMPAPAGCDDVRRVEGIEPTSPRFPVGVTLCAAADAVLLTITSGAVGGATGGSAADTLAALIAGAR